MVCGGNNCKLLQIAFVACLTIIYKMRIAKFSWLDCSFSSSLGITSLFHKGIVKLVTVFINTGKTQIHRRMQVREKQIGKSGGSKNLLVASNICKYLWGFIFKSHSTKNFTSGHFPKMLESWQRQ